MRLKCSMWSPFRLAKDRDGLRWVRDPRGEKGRLTWVNEPGAMLDDQWRHCFCVSVS